MAQQNTLDQKLDLYTQQNRTHRQRKKIDSSSLLGYSIAAGMAMMVPDAMAAIVHNTNSFTVFTAVSSGSTSGPGSTSASAYTPWDIDGNGTVNASVRVSARLGNGTVGTGSPGEAFFYISSGTGLSFGIMSLSGQARNLNTNDTVPGNPFMPNGAGGGVHGYTSVSSNLDGSFLPGSTGYIGFRFDNGVGNGPLFGWAKIRFDGYGDAVNGPVSSELRILEWAYDDSGAPIQVGAVSAVPLPGAAGLMLLGMGSLGLSALRKRKQQYLEKQQAKAETA